MNFLEKKGTHSTREKRTSITNHNFIISTYSEAFSAQNKFKIMFLRWVRVCKEIKSLLSLTWIALKELCRVATDLLPSFHENVTLEAE